FSDTGLEGDHGGLVNITPCEMTSADEEVEIVAEVSVAEVHAPERTEQVDEEDGRGKRGGKEEGSAQGRSLSDRRNGVRHRNDFEQTDWLQLGLIQILRWRMFGMVGDA